MEKARHRSVIKEFGLTMHPYLVEQQEKGLLRRRNRKWYHSLLQVFYRHDLMSQDKDMGEAGRANDKQQAATDRQDARLRGGKHRVALDNIMNRACAAHALQRLSVGDMLQLPTALAGQVLTGLSEYICRASGTRMVRTDHVDAVGTELVSQRIIGDASEPSEDDHVLLRDINHSS